MLVEVEGVITSIEAKTKDDKPYTEIMLAQKGVKEQVSVRLDGNRTNEFDVLEIGRFTGRLFTWKQREGIGSIIKVEE